MVDPIFESNVHGLYVASVKYTPGELPGQFTDEEVEAIKAKYCYGNPPLEGLDLTTEVINQTRYTRYLILQGRAYDVETREQAVSDQELAALEAAEKQEQRRHQSSGSDNIGYGAEGGAGGFSWAD